MKRVLLVIKPAKYSAYQSVKQAGFSLIEIIVGIVVGAIALTLLSTLFFNNAGRSVEPMLQIRAVEFAQSLMDEILSKAFDQQTPIGGLPACVTACSSAVNLGPDGSEVRANYNDVDDYNFYCDPVNPVTVSNALGATPDGFDNFRMSVCVVYDGDYDNVPDSNISAKRITVSIFPPSGAGLASPITLVAYRGNF